MNKPTWRSVACGVPGYDMSSLKYAKRIQELINKGDFVTALSYLQDAKKAEMLHRMQFALPRLTEEDLLFHPHWSRCPKCDQVVSNIESDSFFYDEKGERQVVYTWRNNGQDKFHYNRNAKRYSDEKFCYPWKNVPKQSLLVRMLKWIVR